MSLKTRMIQTMLDAHAKTLVPALNQKLSASFEYVINWACLPEDIAGWGWNDDDLKTCLHTSYFKPVEDALQELFAQPMYRDAITTQLKRIKVEPGRETISDWDIEGDALVVKNTLCANQLNGPDMYLTAARNSIKQVIESKLS